LWVVLKAKSAVTAENPAEVTILSATAYMLVSVR